MNQHKQEPAVSVVSASYVGVNQHKQEPAVSVVSASYVGAPFEKVADVALSIRDALAADSIQDLQSLQDELRRGETLPQRIKSLRDVEELARKYPASFVVLVTLLQALLSTLLQTLLAQAPPPFGDAPPPAQEPTTQIIVVPPSDEEVRRMVDEALRRVAAQQQDDRTTPPGETPQGPGGEETARHDAPGE